MGLGSALPLWIAAAAFVPYAVLLALSARRPRVLDVALFVIADLAYVAACVALAAWPGLLSAIGKELVVLSAIVVLFFVAGQWMGLRRLRSA
jgi:ABC-type transport system involved in multi-copper enzyme maturation permease subunit